MDEKGLGAIEFLAAIQSSSHRLRYFAQEMRNKYGARLNNTQAHYELLFGNPYGIPGDPDSKLKQNAGFWLKVVSTIPDDISVNYPNGKEVGWSLFLRWNKDHWEINTGTAIDHEDDDDEYKDAIDEEYEAKAGTLAECIRCLNEATDFIVNSGDAFAIQELSKDNKI